MIVLLSIGEALLEQARDEKLVGGGSVTVLPEGIDVEVMKTGGLGGLFFSIDHARFIYRQLLAAPRLASSRDRGRAADRRQAALRAHCGRPRNSRARGRRDPVAHECRRRDAADRRAGSGRTTARIVAGSIRVPDELRHEIDHFHLPPASVRNDPTWAEWHYFNVLSPDRQALGIHLVHRRRRSAERKVGRASARHAA